MRSRKSTEKYVQIACCQEEELYSGIKIKKELIVSSDNVNYV